MTQAFFKVATGGSTGVICNCCPTCCVSLQATSIAGRLAPGLTMTAVSGYSVSCDNGKCGRCGKCAEICPVGAIEVRDGGSRTYSRTNCLGCELCVEHCPENALSLFVDPEKPLPLDLDRVRQSLPT